MSVFFVYKKSFCTERLHIKVNLQREMFVRVNTCCNACQSPISLIQYKGTWYIYIQQHAHTLQLMFDVDPPIHLQT